MSWMMAAAITGGASIASGLIGASASKKAAAQQAAAIQQAAAVQERMYQQQRADLAPYRDIGYQSLKDITAQKPYLTGKFEDYRSEYLDPSMAFRLGIGEQTTQRAANVGGGALSGNTLRALQDYSQGLASTEYSNAFNRFQTERGNIYNTLANIAGMGQNAVNTGVQAGQATAQNLGQLAVGGGQAQAAGTMGQANAIASGLGGVGNAAQLYALGSSGFFNRPGTAPVKPTT
jgi:murein L,D-transpeptidase YcbB/YkuD